MYVYVICVYKCICLYTVYVYNMYIAYVYNIDIYFYSPDKAVRERVDIWWGHPK